MDPGSTVPSAAATSDDLQSSGGFLTRQSSFEAGYFLNVKVADTDKQLKGLVFLPCPVEKSVRSLMNVPFTLEKSELEAEFIKEAAKEKMVQLKGHRTVGGMRASIYNAMPLAGVEKLVAFMKDFQAKHA